MIRTTLLARGSVAVLDYRCAVEPGERPFVEVHPGHSLSYVRKGSFGCRTRGRSFDLVPGSVMIGHPGDEYLCTHDHLHGDECLSFQIPAPLVEEVGDARGLWRAGFLPPLADLVVLGELAVAAASGESAVALDEVGVAFASRFASVARRETRARP